MLILISKLISILNYKSDLLDTPLPFRLALQDTASIMASGMQLMHDLILYYLIIVLLTVVWLMLTLVSHFYKANINSNNKYINSNCNSNINSKYNTNYNTDTNANNSYIYRSLLVKASIHGKLIELVWTITPALILLLIAIPTYKLLYLMDLILDPLITVKAIGRQWYWEYQYQSLYSNINTNSNISYINTNSNNNISNINTDSNSSYINTNYNSSYINTNSNTSISTSICIETTDSPFGGLVLANTDTPLVLPIDYQIRLLTTSADVIHSLAVPSLGLKGDAIPGRLNGVSLLINRTGSYYGQCSELCGVNHAYMPINMVGVEINQYITWLTRLHFTRLNLNRLHYTY